jgi:hypothetical protein
LQCARIILANKRVRIMLIIGLEFRGLDCAAHESPHLSFELIASLETARDPVLIVRAAQPVADAGHREMATHRISVAETLNPSRGRGVVVSRAQTIGEYGGTTLVLIWGWFSRNAAENSLRTGCGRGG